MSTEPSPDPSVAETASQSNSTLPAPAAPPTSTKDVQSSLDQESPVSAQKTIRARVYEVVVRHYKAKRLGATDEEIAADLPDLDEGSVRARRRELYEDGLIRNSGSRRLAQTGRKVTIWRPSDPVRLSVDATTEPSRFEKDASDFDKFGVTEIRNRLGMSVIELAKELRVSPSLIYQWEGGHPSGRVVRPTEKHRKRLLSLAAAFDQANSALVERLKAIPLEGTPGQRSVAAIELLLDLRLLNLDLEEKKKKSSLSGEVFKKTNHALDLPERALEECWLLFRRARTDAHYADLLKRVRDGSIPIPGSAARKMRGRGESKESSSGSISLKLPTITNGALQKIAERQNTTPTKLILRAINSLIRKELKPRAPANDCKPVPAGPARSVVPTAACVPTTPSGSVSGALNPLIVTPSMPTRRTMTEEEMAALEQLPPSALLKAVVNFRTTGKSPLTLVRKENNESHGGRLEDQHADAGTAHAERGGAGEGGDRPAPAVPSVDARGGANGAHGGTDGPGHGRTVPGPEGESPAP